jgi:ubiquinone/menaquinone biosynthesis C-methylase UbiE
MPIPRDEVSGLRGQFRNPRGLVGRIAGMIMLVTNRRTNRMVVELLEIQPHEHVLEIGFGPGACVAMLAERATDGFVAGIDPSPTMMAQASARNRRSLRSGRVELRAGSVSTIPYPDESFDKVCSLNNIYFWPSHAADLREIRRTMKPGATLALAFRKEPSPDSPAEPPSFDPEEAKRLLSAAGFHGLQVESRKSKPWTTSCVLARK